MSSLRFDTGRGTCNVAEADDLSALLRCVHPATNVLAHPGAVCRSGGDDDDCGRNQFLASKSSDCDKSIKMPLNCVPAVLLTWMVWATPVVKFPMATLPLTPKDTNSLSMYRTKAAVEIGPVCGLRNGSKCESDGLDRPTMQLGAPFGMACTVVDVRNETAPTSIATARRPTATPVPRPLRSTIDTEIRLPMVHIKCKPRPCEISRMKQAVLTFATFGLACGEMLHGTILGTSGSTRHEPARAALRVIASLSVINWSHEARDLRFLQNRNDLTVSILSSPHREASLCNEHTLTLVPLSRPSTPSGRTKDVQS